MKLFGTVCAAFCLVVWVSGCGDNVSSAGDGTDTPDVIDDRVDTTDAEPDTPVDTPQEDIAVDDVAVEDTAQDETPVEEHGECTSSADCDGRECIRVPDEPGGYRVCADPPGEEASECTNPDIDECCTSEDCVDGEDGGCFYSEDRHCWGPVMMPHNQCFYTQCDDDGDCEGEGEMMCIEAGVFNLLRNTCAYASCKTAADCSERPGGYCKPFMDYCCPIQISGFYCVDPAVCETDDDCDGYRACVPNYDTGWGRCEMVACPM